jgi:hypothetical protein
LPVQSLDIQPVGIIHSSKIKKNKKIVGSEVLTAVIKKSCIWWGGGITPCSPVKINRHFQMKISPSSSKFLLAASCWFLVWFTPFNPENGRDLQLRNIGSFSPSRKALCPRNQNCSIQK